MTVGHGQVGRGRVGCALLTVYVAWGATYPAIRVLDRTVPPMTGMGARFLCAGALLLGGLAIVSPRRLRTGLRQGTRPALAAAAIGAWILGDIGLIAWAEKHVDAGLASLVIASVPLWTIVTRVFAGPRPVRLELLAVLAGLAGLVILVRPGSGGVGWVLMLIFAAGLEATGEVAGQRVGQPADPLVATGCQLLGAGTVLLVAGAATGEFGRLHPTGAGTAAAFAFLVLPGSVLGYAAFVWLLANTPVQVAATYAYVNPVVAVALGALLLGEHIGLVTVAGAALILLSVAAALYAQPSGGMTTHERDGVVRDD
jgi:drug/metabolite transporter (DMT)-like permease